MKSKMLLRKVSWLLILTFVLSINTFDKVIANAEEATSESNLLMNYGFEDKDTVKNFAAKWSPWNWNNPGSTPPEYSWDNTVSKFGTSSVKFSSNTGGSGGANQLISVESGAYYKLGIWIKTSGSAAGKIRYKYTRNGKEDTSALATDEIKNSEWVYQETRIQVPSDAQFIRFEIYMYGSGNVWFDNVSLVKEVSSNNIVINSSFEQTYLTNGIILAKDWATWNASGQLGFAIDSNISYSGNNSIRISASEDSRGAYSQNVAAMPGKTYKFSAYVKTDNIVKKGTGDRGADVRICMWKADGSDAVPPVYLASNTLIGNNDWTLLEKIITIPDNAAKVGVQNYYGVAKGTAWYDEIKVTEHIPVNALKLSAYFGTVKVGNELAINAEVMPTNADNKNIIWSSENPNIASVNNGVITGILEGQTIITATTVEGNFNQKFLVVVTQTDVQPLEAKNYSTIVDEDSYISGEMDKEDSDGNILHFSVFSYPLNGMLRLSPEGNWQYWPNKNYDGLDKFSVFVQNDLGNIGLYEVTITVNAINDLPVVKDVMLSIIQGNIGTVSLGAVDSDKDILNYTVKKNPQHGSLASTTLGNYTYTPMEAFYGNDSFEITVSDINGASEDCKVNVYVSPSGQNIINTLKSVSTGKLHPRILGGAQTFENLNTYISNNDPYITLWFNNTKATADSILSLPPREYEIPDGLRLLDVSREVLRRVRYLGMAYKVTGQAVYAERLWTELNKAGNFNDWNSAKHFLDTAEMTNAFGLAYDWLYDYWSPERKTFIVKAIKEKGLIPGINAYSNNVGWTKGDNNWNGVCNGGLTVGALAVGDESDIDPEIEQIAATILQNAIKGLPYMLKEYMPDGAWNEGPGYWDYGTSYSVYMMEALKQSLNTDYGLSDFPALNITTDFPIYNNGARGSYNFADAGSGIVRSSIILWFGNRYNNSAYYWSHRITAAQYGDPLAMIWYPGLEKYSSDVKPEKLDKKFEYVEVGTMRSNWYDNKGIFLGFKGGYNQFNHGDLDEGSFIYDAYGVRWALDLGAGDYNSPDYWNMKSDGGRWKYYRKRAEGHNTFVLNPGAYPDQDVYARSYIEKFEVNSNETAAIGIVDLSEAYNKDAYSAKRGYSLSNNKTDLLVQDEIRNRKPSDYWWFMHTDSNIEVAADGKSAILTNQDKRLFVQILSDEGSFSVMDAVSLPTSPIATQQNNAGIKKLVVHLENVIDVNLAVRMIPLMSTDNIPIDKPNIIKLDNWSVQEENKLYIDRITINGEEIQDYNKETKVYRVILPYGTTIIPSIACYTSDNNVTTSIQVPTVLPGSAKITVRSKLNTNIKTEYYIELVPDTGITASTAEEGNWPENSMDGDLNSRWAAEGDQWIQYYIGNSDVEAVSIAYFRGSERKYKFDVLISEDGQSWETILLNIETSGTTGNLVQYDFPSIKRGKYIRIFGHGSDVNRWNNIAEVQIHKVD